MNRGRVRRHVDNGGVVPDAVATAVIATGHLVLRPTVVSDAAEMVAILADPALYEFIGGEPPSLADLERRYQRQLDGPAGPGETWHNWIVRSAVNGCAVGFVQATVHSEGATLAWLIGVSYQGHHFASEAAHAVIAWLVRHGVDPDGLTAHIHPDHCASQAVASRVGLAHSGEFDHNGEGIWSSAHAGRTTATDSPGGDGWSTRPTRAGTPR